MSKTHSNIITTPPGPKVKEWISRNEASRAQPPRYIASNANGAYIIDLDGNTYLDFFSQEVNLGHSNSKIIEAALQQITNGGFFVGFTSEVIFSEKLIENAPINPKNYKIGLARGGSSAAEHIIKMVKVYSNKRAILVCLGSCHGNLTGSIALTFDTSNWRKGMPHTMSDVVYVPFAYCYRCPFKSDYPNCGMSCIDYIKYIFDTVTHPDDISSFFIEPIQQHGGILVPPNEYIKEIKKICDEYNILLVDDEVATGFGRTGKMFGIEHYNVEPDIMFLGKPIANGLDLGAVIGKNEIMEYYRGFKGNPVSCAAASANIDEILNNNLIENSEKMGDYLIKRLTELKEKYEIIGDVRGKGLLIGIELVEDLKTKKPATTKTQQIINEAFKRGLLVGCVGTYKQVIRLTPPLIITKEQANEALNILEQSIKKIRDNIINLL